MTRTRQTQNSPSGWADSMPIIKKSPRSMQVAAVAYFEAEMGTAPQDPRTTQGLLPVHKLSSQFVTIGRLAMQRTMGVPVPGCK